MTCSYSPLTLLALKFLLSGGGVGVNNQLKNLAIIFGTKYLSGAIQKRLLTDPPLPPEVLEKIKLLPYFLTGISAISNGTPRDILLRAQRLIGTNNKHFMGIFAAVQNFLAEINPDCKPASKYSGQSFNDIGFMYNNMQDVATGGVSNQFNTAYMPSLKSDMRSWGSMYNFRDPGSFNKPSSVSKNLLDQGLGYIPELYYIENELGIENFNDVTPDQESRIYEIFTTIQGDNLKDILTVTNYNRDNISNLSQVLSSEYSMSESSRLALKDDPSLDGLANKLGNIGGSFRSSNDLADFYDKLDLSDVGDVNDFAEPLPPDVEAAIADATPTGSGPGDTLWAPDLLASATGHGYTDNLENITRLNEEIYNESDHAKILSEEIAKDNPSPEVVNAAVDGMLSDPNLSSRFNEGDGYYQSLENNYTKELELFEQANIDIDNPGKVNAFDFAENLQGSAITTDRYGSSTVLNSLLTDDTAGRAIKACLQEGRNNQIFAQYGINSGTVR